jgi:hypothetical protein
MTKRVTPWVELVSLHADVLSEHFSEDIFALDLGPLGDHLIAREKNLAVKGLPNVPSVYRDPEHFFRSSYITSGLRSLLEDVLSRLQGGSGNRVLKLVTPFGGGKSHTLAALLHAARNRSALEAIPEGAGLPEPKGVRTAVFDGQFFDATNGKSIPGTSHRARTIWGWIAASLGGEQGYELLRAQDEHRVAPGGDEILSLLGDAPNLILLDEVLNYLISAGGIKVHQTTLRDETLTFLQRLTAAVANTTNTALVFSLQSSKRESLEYTSLLQTVDHLAARKDQRREPVEGNEVLLVIQRRLLAKRPSEKDSASTATAYEEIITQMRRARAATASERQQADDEAVAFRARLRDAFPFHPALIDLMRERWAAIPDFQRTRGALRFLAACLRAAHRQQRSRALLGPGDVQLTDAEVRLAFFKEVGQQVDFQAVLEHDFIGPNARARLIDERRAKETPAEVGKNAAIRLATAILMYSFGGLQREGSSEGETLPPGLPESELLLACVGPDLDSTTAQACLKELREQCLYLHYDGVRYAFKKDPNVTLLIEQEADLVSRSGRRVEERIKELLEQRLGGHRTAIVWPVKSTDIPDNDPSFLVAYLPLSFGGKTRAEQAMDARELVEKFGDRPRNFRNGVGLAIPSADHIEALRRSVRYLMAIEQVKAKSLQYHLTDSQRDQLRERERTERGAMESAFLKLYSEVWLPRVEENSIVLDSVAAGGRPLQATLNERKEARIHERVMELLLIVQRSVFSTLAPTKIPELFQIGEGGSAPGLRTSEIVRSFYSYFGFARLESSGVIARAIRRGIQEGLYALTSGTVPTLGNDGRYQLPASKIRFAVPVPEDEIDLDSGFLILPLAIPAEVTSATGGVGAPAISWPADAADPAKVKEIRPAGVTIDAGHPRLVELEFDADRNQLFTAWNAVANLADLSGKVRVAVRAESQDGFDPSKLENGVLEPLREADLID